MDENLWRNDLDSDLFSGQVLNENKLLYEAMAQNSKLNECDT